MLDLTSGWKSQKIEIDGKIIKSTELRNTLWCFRKKCELGESRDYKYCPLFDEKKVERVFNKIPKTINPKDEEQWAYISNNYSYWVYLPLKLSKKNQDVL